MAANALAGGEVADRSVSVNIPARIVTGLLYAAAILLVLLYAAAEYGLELYGSHHAQLLHQKFDLDGENNIPSWFSTILLFLCAGVLGAIGAVRFKQRDGLRGSWIFLSLIFVWLSLDECASIHEMLGPPLQFLVRLPGYVDYVWVIVGIPATLLVGIACRKFVRALPRRFRRAFLSAGIIYCSGAVGMEVVGGEWHYVHGPDFWYKVFVIIEESLEMGGAIYFLSALLEYTRLYVGDVTFRVGSRSSGPEPVRSVR